MAIIVPRPLVEAVRFRLQDYAQHNVLWDNKQLLTDVDVARCIHNAVMTFNASVPILSGMRLTAAATMADDGGTIRSLIEQLAEVYCYDVIIARMKLNEFQFQSGGVTGAREAVWRSLEPIRQIKQETVMRSILEVKMQVNQQAAYGGVESEYAFLYNFRVGMIVDGVVLET